MFWSELSWSSTTPDNLPPNIRFDLAAFQNDPRIRNLTFAADDEGAYCVRFDYRFKASPAPKITLKAAEPIAIKYWRNSYPTVHALRQDFPRHVPHLNETPADEPCHICLWAHGTTAQLYAHHGMAGILRQLNSWLSDTERGTSQKDGWDLTPRYDAITNVYLISDIGKLQGQLYKSALGRNINTRGKALYIPTTEDNSVIEGSFIFDSATPFTARPDPLQVDLFDKGAQSVNLENGIQACPIDVHVMCARKSAALNTHQSVSLHSEENLQLFTNEIGLGDTWRYQSQIWKRSREPYHCIILIGQWREKRLNGRVPGVAEGEAGCIEITTLLLRVAGDGSLSFTPLKYIADVSPNLLATTSGTKQHQLSIAIVGCGALGSVLADSLARSGQGVELVIDSDYLMPHNLARHILTEDSVGYNKAFAIAQHLNTLTSVETTQPVPTDVLIWRDEQLRVAFNTFDLVIDATANLAVHQRLSSLGLNTSIARCYMNGPSGSNGVMYIDEPGNVRHSDCHSHLIAQTSQEPILQEWAKDSQQNNLSSVSIGLGCNSVSLTLPWTTIQNHSSVMVSTLRKWFETKTAVAMINTLHDGLPIGCFIEPVQRPTLSEVPTNRESWHVRMTSSLLSDIAKARDTEVERCGYLLGGFDFYQREIHVTAFSTSTSKTATATRCSLPPFDEEPDATMLYHGSYGMLLPIGSWHTHLGASSPSTIDLNQLRTMQEGINFDNQPAVMLVSGTNNTFEIRVSFPDNWDLKQITKQQKVLTC